nr:phosphoribosyltransferase family protein [Clostridium sp. Marseille-P7770]
MIKIDGKEIVIEKFPDGTPRINLNPYEHFAPVTVEWFYESNEELMYLAFIKKHLEKYYRNEGIILKLPYIPNARMDRTKNDFEVFTLKHFCDFINWLNFYCVEVLDAHSDVSTALLDRCFNESPKEYIENAMSKIGKNIVLYFPDAGAAKRYSNLFQEIPYCYGEKNRDWKTGKILGLTVRTNGINLDGKNVLMVDDICSFGGSMHYSATELKKCGAGKIYAYATHTENSVLNKEKGTLIKDLENNTVERLFTTNSLFTGKHEKITVMEV